ncbi:MAG: hypothetical protein JWR50_721 [Mucilaginibacter sp.]|nr:hypothetical protein [Mucilaginibacter sp.]
MNHLSITTLALAGLIIASCGSGNAGAAGNTSNATTADSAKPSAANKGTITCKIDGKPASFVVQNGFFEIRLDVDSQGPKDGFELLDGSAKKEGFQFEIKNTGTTHIPHGADGCIINYYNADGKVYTGSDVTVTITSFSNGHLTGTFAGELSRWDGDKKIPMQITDGKFDLLK